MTGIDEALSNEANVVAAWRDEGEDSSWLGIYRVNANGATLIADTEMARSDRPATEEKLRQRGVRIGSTGGEVVWVIDDRGLGVWAFDRKITESPAGELQLGDQRVASQAVGAVVSFVDRGNLGNRGVFVEMRDRGRIVVVEEHDPAAEVDPTYNLDNVLIDGAWARQLASELAAWLGVPLRQDSTPIQGTFADQTNTAIQKLRLRCLTAVPSGGRFMPIEEQVAPRSSTRGRVVLRVAPSPSDPETGRYLLLLVYSPSGETESSQWLVDGGRDDVTTFLAGSSSAGEIERAVDKLVASQRRQGFGPSSQ